MIKYIFILLSLISCSSYTALKCGYVLDTKNNKWIAHQVLLIKDGKIVALNPPALPAKTKLYDFSSSYVIPGLIDAHSHLFLEENTYAQDFAKGLQRFINSTTDAQRMELGRSRIMSLSKRGFTSVRDLGNQGGVKVSDLGKGPLRIYSSGPGFSPLHGQFPIGTDPKIIQKEYPSLQGNPPPFSSDLVKLYADEDPNPAFADPWILKTWVQAAHVQNLKVAAHASLPKGIELAISSGADSLEHGTYISQAQLNKMKLKKMILVPTHADSLFLLPGFKKYQTLYTPELIARTCKNMTDAQNMGVAVAFGSDNYFSLEKDGLDFGSATLEVLLAFRRCGLSELFVLRAATYEAARSMGKEEIIGQIKAGSFADLIVLKKNPEENLLEIKSPQAVFFNGELSETTAHFH